MEPATALAPAKALEPAAAPEPAATTTTTTTPPADADHVALAWAHYLRLGSPRYWAAPLVGRSDLAWRILVRRHGAQCASSPMIDAAGFVRSAKYRAQWRLGEPGDAPLVVQLGSGNAADAAAAAALCAQECEGCVVELNVGCPQRCAKRTKSGAFLLEDPDRLCEIVAAMRAAVPAATTVACKIRVLEADGDTVALARRLQGAGCGLLTVHGRTRRQGGGKATGGELASWPTIAAVARAVEIPVVANGNVRHRADAEQCIRETGCAAVMSGCGLLRDPFMYERPLDLATAGELPAHIGWQGRRAMALEYLAIRNERCAESKDDGAGVAKHMKDILGGSLAPPSDDQAAWAEFRAALTKHGGGPTLELQLMLEAMQ